MSEASIVTQERWLANDCDEIVRLVDSSQLFAKLIAQRDLPTHALRLVVADLAWQVLTHTKGISVLLEHRLRAPLLVAQRACFEGLISLAYLVQHADAKSESQAFLAHSFINKIESLSEDSEFLRERERNLARIPDAIVEVARSRRSKHPRTWSGPTIKEMAKAGHVTGYESGYRFLSREAHLTVIGSHVRVFEREEGGFRVIAGRELEDFEAESQANFARRNLHSTFRLLWHALEGGDVQVRSEDPAVWLASVDEQPGRWVTE